MLRHIPWFHSWSLHCCHLQESYKNNPVSTQKFSHSQGTKLTCFLAWKGTHWSTSKSTTIVVFLPCRSRIALVEDLNSSSLSMVTALVLAPLYQKLWVLSPTFELNLFTHQPVHQSLKGGPVVPTRYFSCWSWARRKARMKSWHSMTRRLMTANLFSCSFFGAAALVDVRPSIPWSSTAVHLIVTVILYSSEI